MRVTEQGTLYKQMTEHEIIVWWGTVPGNVSWCWTISVTCELYLGGVKV